MSHDTCAVIREWHIMIVLSILIIDDCVVLREWYVMIDSKPASFG